MSSISKETAAIENTFTHDMEKKRIVLDKPKIYIQIKICLEAEVVDNYLFRG